METRIQPGPPSEQGRPVRGAVRRRDARLAREPDPAEQYRKAHWPNDAVDIAICQDPNVHKAQLGDRAVIYNF